MILRHLWKSGLVAVVLVFYSVSPINAQSNNVGAFIDQVIGAYGGRKNILSIKSYRLEATMQTHVQKGIGKVTRVVEGPLRLKVLIRYPSDMEIRLLDGEKSLRGFAPDKLASVEGPLRDSMVLQAARADIPWILDNMRSKIRLTKAKDGQSVLEIPLGKGMYMNAFVDAKTHLVTRAETVSEGEMELQFAADYSDFRKVDNVLFPFHEENYASGSHTATTKVDSIKLNPSGEALELPIPK
ncbi:MAG: hypothetical protein PHX78_00905 [bacterium]|nr:hypothetical protein [bacterium]